MYDPDAPTGSGFWHWVVVDIPSQAAEIRAGAGGGSVLLPPGAPHRHVFTLHAVAVDKLPVPNDVSGAMVGFVTNMNKVGEASFTVTYGS
jgi:phosphatidylethanolamine-binding protein (PEBP) family uncharacterized protein